MYFVEDLMILCFVAFMYVIINQVLALPYHITNRDVNFKKRLTTFCTVVLFVFCGGPQFYHHLILVMVSYLSLKFFGKKCHLVGSACLIVQFFYFRIYSLSGIPIINNIGNLSNMMLSLRTIGIVFEKRDTLQKVDDGVELSPAEHALMDISLAETFHYCFFNLNVTTPYYTYKTFHDYFNLPFARSASIVCWEATRNRILTIFGLFTTLMVLQTYWPVTAIVTDEFYNDRSLLYRILYIYPMILIFRLAFFTVSLSSELFLFVTGFGAYPVESEPKTVVGPTKPITQEMLDNCRSLKYSYITIETNDILKIEMTSSFYVVIKNWNKTVQWFIAYNIFKRLPYKTHPIPSRIITFILSVFWHGNDIGYFCTLLPGIGVLVITQKMIDKTFLGVSNSVRGKFLATLLLHVIKHFAMGYLIMSTWLQSFERCWRYYSSVHHIGLIILLSIYLLTLAVNVSRRKNIVVELQKRINSFLL